MNLHYAHRFVPLSAAVPDPLNPKRARMIPIAMRLIPKRPKPAPHAPPEDGRQYEEQKELNRPGQHARRLLRHVRAHLDAGGQTRRRLCVCGDGDYSNSTVLTALPPRTDYLGRTRSDLNLHRTVATPARRRVGRPRAYGKKLPTPREVEKDAKVPWRTVEVQWGADRTRIRYKRLARVKWPPAGEAAVVQIIILAPLRYRKRKHGPWLRTPPAYLVCTEPDRPVLEVIQTYFWRWGIEVNFKEEKQLFGVGEAQVRIAPSVATAPAVAIAAYAALLLAGLQAYGFHGRPATLCPPKWYPRKGLGRVTGSDLIRQVRHELLLDGVGNFWAFAPAPCSTPTAQKSPACAAA